VSRAFISTGSFRPWSARPLTAALTFGGCFDHGLGFAIPIIIRYVLETCATVEEAVDILRHIPSSGVHNVILLDRDGATAVVFLRPNAPASISREAMTTNHQETVPAGSSIATSSAGRKARLGELQGRDPDTVTSAFMRPPLYHQDFTNWFGTLYTVAYRPTDGVARYIWPGDAWEQSIDSFEEGERTVRFIDAGPVDDMAAE
jgi:predicted choloylglycine hydrolase